VGPSNSERLYVLIGIKARGNASKNGKMGRGRVIMDNRPHNLDLLRKFYLLLHLGIVLFHNSIKSLNVGLGQW
jgi:hypothetical protein